MIGLQRILPAAAPQRRSAKQRFLERDERRRTKEAGLFESRRELAESRRLEALVEGRRAPCHEHALAAPSVGIADLLLAEL